MQLAARVNAAAEGADEQQLIARVLRGERAACRELYDAHAPRIYRTIYRMVGDEDTAKDFTQDAFVRAFRKLGDFRGDASLVTWLHSIAISVTLNGLRREKKHRALPLEIGEARSVAGASPSVEPDVRERLFRAVDALSDIYRTVVILHDMEGYTHAEIGRMIGVPEGTSKARLSVARARLRDALADVVKE